MAKRLNLVTGAMGFTGSHVIRELLAAGEKVVGTDRPAALEDSNTRELVSLIGLDLDHPNLELVPSNLLDPDSLRPLVDRPITHVFHTASLYDYSAPLERLRRVNVDGTRHLLEQLRGKELQHFVHWSTCGVFGKPYTAANGEKVNVPFDESSPSPKNTGPNATGPGDTPLVNPYSVTKWEQEKLIWKAHREEGLPLTVVRPAPIYGPGSAYGHGGIILAIAMGLVPAIPADARNYITTSVHVDDVARFGIFAAEHPDRTMGEDYNVVDNSIISYHEFLHYIGLLTGRPIRDVPLLKMSQLRPVMLTAAKTWNWLERRFHVPRVSVFEPQSANYVSSSYWLSNRKSLSTGFDYRYPDVREGLKDTVAWFRDVGWLHDPARKLMVRSPGGSKAAA